MRRNLFLRIALVTLALTFQGAAARADDDGDGEQESRLEQMQEAVERGDIKSLGELKAIVRDMFPGEIVHVATSGGHGHYQYEFRVLRADGRLVDIEMDAASGKVLEVENDE